MVVRRMRDEKMEEYFQAKRKLLGVEAIYSQPRRECIQRCLEVLSSGKVLFIQLDQNFGSGGVFVDFFDQKAATATGPVVFALRTGAPIVPLFIVRQKDNSHRIIIEPEFRLEEQADQHQTIVVNIARITKIIERYIRDYPQEWGWIHRRWKSRPAGSP
jgi:KDO2-lipid IV(A) lauroyltransferase